MKILIADDDWLIRFTTKSMLNEIGDFIIEEAVNGAEMVEKYKLTLPDIVFADIKMPLMNGLEAIEKCKEVTDSEFVIVTSYSDFEYAQKGIQLGIHDYLVKPLELERLKEIVDAIQDKIMTKSKQNNFEFQLSVTNLVNYYPTIDVEDSFKDENLIDGYNFLSIIFITRTTKGNKQYFEYIRVLSELFTEYGKMLISHNLGYHTSLLTSEGLPLNVFYCEKHHIKHLMNKMSSMISNFNDTSVPFLIVTNESDNLYDTYFQSVLIDDYQMIASNYDNLSMVDFKEVVYSYEELLFFFNLELMISLVENKEIDQALLLKNKIININQRSHLNVDIKKISNYISLILKSNYNHTNLEKLLEDIIRKEVIKHTEEVDKSDQRIEVIKQYLENNYMNDIGVAEVADLHDLTPNYVSTIFHQETGRKFLDYLTELRMAKAATLLIDKPNTTVSDIAIMVGYNSARHFSTLFQKYYHMTPTQYRKVH